MAFKQSEAAKDVSTSWTESAKANPNESPEQIRDRIDIWGDLTAEPGHVDYLEIEVAGMPVLWAVPKNEALLKEK